MKKKLITVCSIGSGGAGSVYKVLDKETGEYFALKRFSKNLLSKDHLQKVEKEVRIMNTLDHPHVLTIMDWEVNPNNAWYLMPLADSDLVFRMRRLPLNATDQIKTIEQIGQGLTFLHRSGVVHRDLRMDNILLFGENAVIGDFGLARFTKKAKKTFPSEVPGTRSRSIVSIFHNRSGLSDEQKDIELFGRLVISIVAGKVEFLSGPSFHQLFGESPLAKIIRRCIEPVPKKRFQTMEQVCQELKSVSTQSVEEIAASFPNQKM